MLVGYFGLRLLHTQRSYVSVKLGDGSLLSFLDGQEDQAHELIILGRNKLIGSPFLRPHVPPVWRHGGEKRKERDGVSLAFGIAGPRREARTAGY